MGWMLRLIRRGSRRLQPSSTRTLPAWETLGVNQYEERLKLPPELNTVRLSYLPLVMVAPATTPIVTLQGRYGIPRRGEWPFPEMSLEFALVFSLPGMWTAIDPTTIDIWADSGELTFPVNALELFFNEVDVVYNAGWSAIPTHRCRWRVHR